jgi:spermidine/putrescine transport system substrate-binding protein/spermidine/putrescine transport system permease protein
VARAKRPSALALLSLLVYAFLYAPLAVLVVFSFNAGRLAATWQGFTLSWYLGLLGDRQILFALRNSLLVAFLATSLATLVGTAAALALQRHAFRRRAAFDALVTLPIVVPEIVLASSLALLFGALRLRLGLVSVVLAHVGFSLSYVVIVVRARLAGFDRGLEEAARDLGAGAWRSFLHVTLPGIAPGVLAAALLVFALSIDDYVITSFVAGVGSTTLPIQIYSMVKSGVSPAINAVSTLLLVATSLLLVAAQRLEEGGGRRAALPGLLGLFVLLFPFLTASPDTGGRVLNLFIWSNYIAPETIHEFERRFDAHVNVDLYDTNEALLAKLESANVAYDVICPSNYPAQVLIERQLLRPLDRSALPHLKNVDPGFLGWDFDPGNRYTTPYFWGVTGIGYRRSKVGAIDSWAALFDPRYAGRILMLDDPRETFGAALKWQGFSMNATDPVLLRRAQALLIAQKPLVRAYNSSNFEDVLLAGDVWLEQGWNGQIARAMEQDKDIGFVIPKEGAATYLDSLAIPKGAPHPELAHAFIDFTLEAKVAAEICRTMKYSSPNRAGVALLPPAIRDNPVIFPTSAERARLEVLRDLGPATVLYERLWTEVKTAR